MMRRVSPLLLVCLLLSGCERVVDVAASMRGGPAPKRPPKTGEASSVALSSTLEVEDSIKSEVMIAFAEIALSAYAHNAKLLENYDAGLPVNGPAYSEGIRTLDRAGHRHGGLTKQIIDAVNLTLVYEKTIFVVFDTMDRQMSGMETQGGSFEVQRRNYIRIIDGGISAYETAVSYLESGEEARLRHNFKKKMVPSEVVEEFVTLKKTNGEKLSEIEKKMFTAGRDSLQSYRDAFVQNDPSKAQAHIAQAKRYQADSKRYETQMIAELRKMMKAIGKP